MTVVIGLALAAVAWWWLFQTGGRSRFWSRALVAGTAIGAYAVLTQRGRLDDLLDGQAIDVAIGAAAATALYLVFGAGDRFLRVFLPSVAAEIGQLYQVRKRAGTAAMTLALVVVGTCEELFWRGLVQQRAGFAVALAGYTAVHLVERKWALALAAAAAGAAWGALFAWRGTLIAPIVSHVLWDLAVVVWFPLRDRS